MSWRRAAGDFGRLHPSETRIPLDEVRGWEVAGGQVVVRTLEGDFRGSRLAASGQGRVNTGFGMVAVEPAAVRRIALISPRTLLREARAVFTFSHGAADTSGHETHGTLEHGASTAADPQRGEVLRLDGQDDRVSLGNAEALQITGSLTIAMWIRPDRLEKRVNPYGKAYGGEGTITLEPNGTINFYYGTAGSNSTPYQGFTTQRAISAGRWTHIAIVRDAERSTLSWYIDGRLDQRLPMSYPTAVASTLSASLGDDYVEPLPGCLDDVVILARALDPAEIEQLTRVDLGAFDRP